MSKSFFLFFLFLGSVDASAWWDRGHSLICEEAYKLLSSEVKDKIDPLIDEFGSFGRGCLWADWIKGERKETRSWHYINLSNEEQDVSKAICPKNGCIFDAFYSQIKILKDTKKPFLKKQEALMFVGHFVGDIHQPMHTGYPHDLGGNLHRLKFSNGNKTNMHKMWDGQIIEYMEVVIGSDRFEEAIQEKIHTFLSIDHSSKIENWAQESRDIAMSQSVGYRDNVLEIATDEYMESHFDIVQNRIALAVIRLSKTLNSIYKTNH